MTTRDEFRRLGADLLAFAKDAALNKDQAFTLLTPTWAISRTQDDGPPASATYSWRARKGIAQSLGLEHTLYVESDADGGIYRIVLSCALAVDLVYDTHYWVEHGQIAVVGFAQRQIVDPVHDVWQFWPEPPLFIGETLCFVPARMRKSFPRAELASVS